MAASAPAARALRTAGWVAAAASACFALLALWVVLAPDGLLPGDAATHRAAVTDRSAAALAAARAVTSTGSGPLPYALVVAAGLYAGRTGRRRLTLTAALVLCLGAGQALRYAVMTLIARPRPPLSDWATHALGCSFPSGHATVGALTAGLLITALLTREPPPPRIALLAALIAVWGAAVGLTRVYLGVHWYTDVLGGWLFATAWLALCVCGCLWGRTRRTAP
ncbi:phosphatase PAP2 family protein [Streptomyces sp. NPDC059564]|uniref:phosphatase PAP2 family protein n=1 Tax=Streptomyces sp. NPDC059564 TaxID=3346865 RepID=UPI0036BA876E